MDKTSPFSLVQVQSILDAFSVGKVVTVSWLETQSNLNVEQVISQKILKAVVKTTHGIFYLVGMKPDFASSFYSEKGWVKNLQHHVDLDSAELMPGANDTFLTHRFDFHFFLFKK